jgi:NADH-quinone oxidoreductase subunit I
MPASRPKRGGSNEVEHATNGIGHNGVEHQRHNDSRKGIRGQDQSDGGQGPGVRGSICEMSFHGRPLIRGTDTQAEKFPVEVCCGRANLTAWADPEIGGILCGMGMPSLLRKVFLVDLLQGLRVTFRYQDPREIYTEQYPLERPQVAERYRGAPRLNVNPDTDETMCIACDLCALACPEHLIVVSSERNEKTRRKELTNFTYDLSRCMFCGLCEDACPTDALELTQDFELASYTREGAIWDRQMLEKGPQPTQYRK